jgi:TetR/AcrR family transcriptional regulator
MPSAQFLNLSKEKQEQIIRASLAEFAEYGYDLASTNRIVQRADISKGVLFKYFDDKATLFTYVGDVCMRGYFDTMPRGPVDDFFEFIRRATLHKMQFLRDYPLTYQLMVRVLKEPKHPVYAKVIANQFSLSQQFTDDLKNVLRQEELRPGLTWQHVMDFMTWVGFGLQEKYMASIPDVVDERLEQSFQPMIEELNVYLDILKFGMYKEVPES